MKTGTIIKVAGPLVTAGGMEDANIQDVCLVGGAALVGEIIEMRKDVASVQVYEETSGVGPGEPMVSTGEPLSVELGPGLVGEIFDGIQRPLTRLLEYSGDSFIKKGVRLSSLNREKKWRFVPLLSLGDPVEPGDVLGTVQETRSIVHKIMVPAGISGVIEALRGGEYSVDETIAVIRTDSGSESLTMIQRWPVRYARPVAEKRAPHEPFVTGQRVIDTFFPVIKGGTAAIPGPFGAGKTVIQHQIAKWSNVDLVVYVGCGERGNEMTDILNEFPALKNTRTGDYVMERTVLIANTSNMPVAAREASIYTGITIAEYFRDMGYHVAIMADSTSRWAEALREMSGRLQEMPGDEGYPAYLGSRISNYYERAGCALALGKEGRVGSVTAISSVSPPGGDIAEPVTQNTLRVVKVFWGLDASLARQRHFPAIHWLTSYSLYSEQAHQHIDNELGTNWSGMVRRAVAMLQEESKLEEVVRLVGVDSLSGRDRMTLEVTKSIREDYLQQNSFDPTDSYASLRKQCGMLELILRFADRSYGAIEAGVPFQTVMDRTEELRDRIARSKSIPEERLSELAGLLQSVDSLFMTMTEERSADHD